MFEFYNDWKKSEKDLVNEQNRKSEKAIETQKKLDELNEECNKLQDIVDKLSEEQKEMLKNVPRTQEEWDKFNEIGDDIEKKEERMLEIFKEVGDVINELPLSGEEFNEQWKKLAMDVMKRHRLNN